MLKSVVNVGLGLALAAPVTAQVAPADPASAPSAQQKAKESNRMICEKQEGLARGSAARRSARLLLSGRNGVSRTVTCWKIGSGSTRTRERLPAKPIESA